MVRLTVCYFPGDQLSSLERLRKNDDAFLYWTASYLSAPCDGSKASLWDTSSGMHLNCDGEIETGLWEMDRKSGFSSLEEKRASSQVMLRTLGRRQKSQGCGPWGRLLAELSCFPEMDVRSRELNHSNSPWATEPETNCHRGLLNLYFIPQHITPELVSVAQQTRLLGFPGDEW